ncbi:NPCBM/NEW2 domain-containing protein [Akkermansia muciniphila]|uniref:NPCBM/NEW2 domain-containing protein n=1 Tax=Akkermansia muciniphila TaxID=239935 RepID=UPI0027D26408|nr:NPCBM/NEW2 domain-containing protein [Akkermansia muciniphila]WMB16715.1 NPCBM/NEW2 domain-containing protein [Akkermansia muciniphila]
MPRLFFAYDLDGRWKEFRADVGLPFGSRGSVKFSVYLDGRKLMESPVLKDGDSIPVKTAVEGGRKLEIRVDDAGDGNAADWGIIANGMLTR